MKTKKFFKKLIALALIVLVVVVIVNYQIVYDFVRGMFYSPSVEMTTIRDNLNLTSRGNLIFNASQPELNSEDDFNTNCMLYNEDESILGCYVNQKIYVYYIKDENLDGILELTAAHELLHAVYERMSIKERDDLRRLIEETYNKNLTILKGEIESYGLSEQLEEMYVRIGTEIKELPEELEKHYATIFKNQDGVVEFYERYIRIFREIEKEFKELEAKMTKLNSEIDSKTLEYENGVKNLNREIEDFNNCADTAGCFSSDNEFYDKRSKLLEKQDILRLLYEEIDRLINEYNTNVAKYNENVVKNTKLQNIVNSHVKVEGI